MNKDELRSRIKVWDVLNRFFRAEIPSRCGLYASPLREDENKSFSIFAGGDVCKDHGTGESWDIFGLLTGPGGKSFSEAVRMLEEWTGEHLIVSGGEYRKPLPEQPDTPEGYHELKEECLERAEDWMSRPSVLMDLCLRKRWNPEHMNKLVDMGVVGLSKNGAAWIMNRGIKKRGDAFISHEDRWICGKGRQNLFLEQLSKPSVPLVFLFEGESDSLTALFSGVTKGGKSCVLGIPGASIRPLVSVMKPLVYGKLVVMVGDNDKAGHRFHEGMGEHLRKMGVMAKHIDWSGIGYNDVSDMYVGEGAGPVRDFLLDSSKWLNLKNE